MEIKKFVNEKYRNYCHSILQFDGSQQYDSNTKQNHVCKIQTEMASEFYK